MVDIDDKSAAVCPIIELVQPAVKLTTKIFKVSWYVHNFDSAVNKYSTSKKERFFETLEGAKRFNEERQKAASLLGLLEDRMSGYPVAVEVESDR